MGEKSNFEKNDLAPLVDAGTLEKKLYEARSYASESLFFVARFHNIQVELHSIENKFSEKRHGDDVDKILHAANYLNVKSGLFRFTWERLEKAPFPALIEKQDGTFFVAMKKSNNFISVHDPSYTGKVRFIEKNEFLQIATGRVVLLRPRISHVNTNQKFGLGWFKDPILNHRKVLFEVFLAAFFVQIFALAMPMMSQVIFDKVVIHNNVSTLNVLGFGMVLVILFEALLSMLQNYLLAHTAGRIDVLLGSKIFGHLIRLPIRYFEKRKVGDISSHVREMDGIRQFLMGTSIGVILDIFFVGIFILLMFYYSEPLSFIVIAALPFFVLITWVAKPNMRKALESRMEASAATQSFLVETITGIHTVKSLAIEEKIKLKWDGLLARQAVSSLWSSRLGSIFNSFAQVIQKISVLAILWYGAHLVIKGSLTVGELIAFQMLSNRVIQPVVRLTQVWQDLNGVVLSISRLGDIMDNKTEIDVSSQSQGSHSVLGNVNFRNVTFRYGHDQPPVISNLTLDIAAGQTVGIVGRSGSGKSTLTKLIQRIYYPDSGLITVDGLDLRNINPTWLRSQIGVVLQENYLFNGSISENICVQNPQAPFEKILEASRLACAHEFIADLPRGYDTQVGERGTALSGGQRQRIAIARALLNDPKILIFDEATSALDSESERLIQESLENICKERTVFIVAHRLSTVRNAHQIIVLDKGEIVEKGNHETLIKMDSLYAKLFAQQTGINSA